MEASQPSSYANCHPSLMHEAIVNKATEGNSNSCGKYRVVQTTEHRGYIYQVFFLRGFFSHCFCLIAS